MFTAASCCYRAFALALYADERPGRSGRARPTRPWRRVLGEKFVVQLAEWHSAGRSGPISAVYEIIAVVDRPTSLITSATVLIPYFEIAI